MLLFPFTVQTGKKALRLCGKVDLLVLSGVAPNSDLPSSRTSTFKRYVALLAMGSIRTLIATPVRLHVFSSPYQYLPVSITLFRSILPLIWTVSSHVTVPLGRAEGQVGNRAHDATIGGHLADTGEKRAQDHVGRARGHFAAIFIVSWSTVGGIRMRDGCLRMCWFQFCSRISIGLLLPISSETLPLCRMA